MKTLNASNRFTFIYLFSLLCISFFIGCSKTEILPEINGSWKLVGFVNKETDKVILVDHKVTSCTDCYVITLKENHEIEGYTRSNYLMGKFQLLVDNKKMTISQFGLRTYAGETEDGYRFIDAMKKVNAYDISSKGLTLYYDKNVYLLFEPIDPSILRRSLQ